MGDGWRDFLSWGVRADGRHENWISEGERRGWYIWKKHNKV